MFLSPQNCILLVVHVYFILNAYMYLNLLQINIFLFSILKFVWTSLESVLYIRMIRRYYSRNLRGSINYMHIYSLWVIVSYTVESLNPWNIRFLFVFSITEWLNECMSSWGSSGDFSICVNMLFFYHDDKFLANTRYLKWFNQVTAVYIFIFISKFSKLVFKIVIHFLNLFFIIFLIAFKRSNSTWLS